MAKQGRIQYSVEFKANLESLKSIEKELQTLKNMTAQEFQIRMGLDDMSLEQAKGKLTYFKGQITQIQKALSDSFNSSLNTYNIDKFNAAINKIGFDRITKTLLGADQASNNMWKRMMTQATSADKEFKKVETTLDRMADTFSKTVKWGISSSIFNRMTGELEKAWSFTQKLDKSLNDIRIVTGASADNMREFAVQANQAAARLGASTTDYTNAALIYYQQGLSDAEVKARTDITLKTANITRQAAAEVSEQLTAVWNGYNVSAQESEVYIDKLAAVATATASDLEELSTGMGKVASAANSMGVDIDQLNAQLATIISVTRQAPESVGTALKTIYARMGDLKINGEDEFGVSLGQVTSDLEAVGISVLDNTGNLREMGDVIEEVAGKWKGWNDAQKTSVAIAMAGTRQYNNLVALFDNWGMYESSLNISQNSAGTINQQQETYMESIGAHLKTLSTSFERLFNSLFEADSINILIDGFTQLVDLAANWSESLGGGVKTLGTMATLLTTTFRTQIGNQVGNALINRYNSKNAQEQLEILNKRQQDVKANIESNKTAKNTTPEKEAALKEQEDYVQTQIDMIKYGATEDDQRQIKEARERYLEAEASYLALVKEESRLTEELAKLTGLKVEDAKKSPNAKLTTNDYNIEKVLNDASTSAAEIFTKDDRSTYRNRGESLVSTEKLMKEWLSSSRGLLDKGNIFEVFEQLKHILIQLRESQDKNLHGNSALKDTDFIKLFFNSEYSKSGENGATLLKSLVYTSEFKHKYKGAIGTDFTQINFQDNGRLSNEDVQMIKERGYFGLDKDSSYKDVRSAVNASLKATGTPYKAGQKQYNLATNFLSGLSILEPDKTGNKFSKEVENAIRTTIPDLKNSTSKELFDLFYEQVVEYERLISGVSQENTQLPENVRADIARVLDNFRGNKSKSNISENKELAKIVMESEEKTQAKIKEQAELQKAGQQLFDQINGIASIITSLQSIITLPDIWENQNLKTGEKVFQTISNVATTLPLLISGLSSLKGLLEADTWKNIGKLLLKNWKIAAVIAAITAVTIGIQKLVEWYDKDALAAEKAAQKTQELKAIFEEATQASQNLKSSLEDYEKAIRNIELLDKSTLEYKNAIIEANNKAIELLKTNKELAKYAYRDNNGLIHFTEEGTQQVLEQQLRLATQTQIDYFNSTVDTNNKTIQAQITDYQRKHTYDNNRTDMHQSDWVEVLNYGNIDLKNRPQYIDEDGNLSTVASTSFMDENGKEILVPTIYELTDDIKSIIENASDRAQNGIVKVTNEEAQKIYEKTGQNLGKFDNAARANQYAQMLHEAQQYDYLGQDTGESGQGFQIPQEIIEDIASYMYSNNTATLLEEDLAKIESVANASSDLQLAILDNVESLEELSNSINDTKNQTELMAESATQSYLQMKGIIDDDGKLSVEEIITSRIMNNAGGVDVSEEAKSRAEASIDTSSGYYLYKEGEEALDFYKQMYGVSLKQSNSWRLLPTATDAKYDIYSTDGTNEKTGSISLKEIVEAYYAEQIRDERANASKELGDVESKEVKNLTQKMGLTQFSFAEFLASARAGENGEIKIGDAASFLSPEQADKLFEIIKSGNFDSQLSSVLDYGELNTDFIEKLLQSLSSDFNLEAFIENISKEIDAKQGVLDILSKGDISELEEEQIKNLEKWEDEYVALAEIRDRTSHEYLSLLREIKEAEESEKMDGLQKLEKEQTDKLQEKIDIFTNRQQAVGESFLDSEEAKTRIQEIEEMLQSLSDTKYEIKVAIDEDLASDVDDAFGIAEELGQLQDSIQDDLTYTFEEAQELIDAGYAEMFTNAKETSENTIQVNKDVMNSFIDDKQAEIEADRQAKIEQLETQKVYLQAQKDALVKKLEALQEAAKAENATDAATAMAKVNNAELEYQAQTEALNAELEDEAEAATESQNINATLFNALGGMYDNNALNQQLAEKTATDNQALNIQNRIDNVKTLFDAYVKLGEAVEQSSKGAVQTQWSQGDTKGGVEAAKTAIENIEAGIQEATPITTEELKKQTENLFNTNKQQYDDTIAALIESTKGQIDSIDAQIGAADAGIAALKSAGSSLDKAQSSAKAGGSGKDADYMEFLEDEKDIYHDINIILKQIETELGRLEKQQDKLIGQDLMDNLNEQVGLLNDQIAATGDKIKIARGEAEQLKTALTAKGVTFNEDGTMANYFAVYDAQKAYVDNLIAQYNAMGAEQQEANKDAVEAAKEQFEQFVSDMERYDEVVTDLIPELEDDIQEAVDQKIELEIEKFNMKIQVELDLHEAEQDWLDFKKKVLDGIEEDDILGNATADLAKFYNYLDDGRGYGVLQAQTEQLEKLLQQAKEFEETGWASAYGDNQAQLLEDIQTNYQEMMGFLEEAKDLVDQIRAYYVDMMEEAAAAFDDQIALYEQMNDIMNHDMNVIKMVYGEDSYEALANYYQQLEDNYNNQVDFQRQQVDLWKAQMDTLEEGSDEWKKAKEEWMNAVTEWNAAVEASIENLTDKYLNAINNIFKQINNQVTDGFGLDYMEQEWDLINQKSEMYLDTINAMYETQKLANKYQDAIDETDSISAQKKLNTLMNGEIQALREKDKLTKYDVERAELRYQIALKQIALEEAQQNKNTMRLKRDSQGNYTYQYVADEDEIGKIEDEIGDLYNRLYNLDYEEYENNLQTLLDIWKKYQEDMIAAAQINDPEARAQREALIQQEYTEMLSQLTLQNEEIKKNLNESTFADLMVLYAQDAVNYQNMTEQEKELLDMFLDGRLASYDEAYNVLFEQYYNVDGEKFTELEQEKMNLMEEEILPRWNTVVQTMADNFGGVDNENSLLNVMKATYDAIQAETEQYETDLEELQEAAKKDFDQIKQGIDSATTSTAGLIVANEQLIGEYDALLGRIASVIQQLNNTIATYGNAFTAAKNATSAAYEYWVNAQQAAAAAVDLGNQASYAASAMANLANAQYAVLNGQPYNGGTGGTKTTTTGTTPSNGGDTGSSQALLQGPIQSWSDYSRDNPSATYSDYEAMAASFGITNISEHFDLKKRLASFDTGGYTGDWGTEKGKVAMVHEKELVLNARDTENMLNAVSIMRAIGGSTLLKIAQMSASANGFNNMLAEKQAQPLEQKVEITATFPNVSSSSEIEDALNNLVNSASQRINRKES